MKCKYAVFTTERDRSLFGSQRTYDEQNVENRRTLKVFYMSLEFAVY